MNTFTISELQGYTGINVHSIRAWEKRYHALTPHRTEGNTRYYNSDQLRRLLNIASLMDSEHKISELCSFPDSKLHELVGQTLEATSTWVQDELLVSQMVASALSFDEELFNRIFTRSVIAHGMEGTYLKVIYPTLNRLGMMWSINKVAPAQEHFMTHLIRQKLSTAIDLLPINLQAKQHWLLFLPENEFHETGLLIANYLIRLAGHRCAYLGANVPLDTLKNAVSCLKPDTMLMFMVSRNNPENDLLLLKQFQKTFPKQKLFIASQEFRFPEKIKEKVTVLHSLDDLKKVIG